MSGYKICSTFDSSPVTGNFGTAIECARKVFGKVDIPVLAACPDFGRYTCFSNHFERFGDDILRFDRHPSMSVHPSTPMTEADLVAHLGQQTDHSFTK